MTKKRAGLLIDFDLIENPKYQTLDTRAAMLYSLYADRSAASLHNAQLGNMAFCDAHGVFIRFSNALAAKIIRVSEKTIGKFRKQLAEVGLIEVIRDGLKGYKIYVKEIQETPANVKLLMPWKNHNIQIKKTVSDWTITSLIEKAKNMATNAVVTVNEKSSTTYQKNVPLSLSQDNLSQCFNNNLGLTGNAHAREASQIENQNKSNKKTQNPYHLLPDSIKKSFNRVFGFITAPVAIELQSLIKLANEDMLNYAITSSEGRKITSPINYLKAAITNAVKRGAKCVQDMIDYYNSIKSTPRSHGHSKQRFMSAAQAQKEVDEDMERLRVNNPQVWLRIKQEQKAKSQPKPLIPIYHLGE